jgi:ATP-dependent RNA helicase RhlE
LSIQFSSLSLSKPILDALTHEGYTTPTPIQAQAIPAIMQGKDLLGCAQTGTGKTAAFALPILHMLSGAPTDTARRGPALPRTLILSPTRELATQIGDSFATYGRNTSLSHTVIFGGVSQFHQTRALSRGVDVVVATPGRLMDLMEQGLINLSQVSIFVLDEADRMLDMGFIQPIRRIASALTNRKQTLLFSATMPREIMHLADSLLKSPVKVSISPQTMTAAGIAQSVYMVGKERKPALLAHLLTEHKIERGVVFTRTKHGADRVTRRLLQQGISAEVIHGNKAQNQRQRALERFRSGRSRVLVATDVAARGLDVDGITHVFNYDLPNEPEAYIHRIGRTARAGASGIAISFCDSDERGYLRDIERLTKQRIDAAVTPTDLPEPVRSEHPGDSFEQERRYEAPRGPRQRGKGVSRPTHRAPHADGQRSEFDAPRSAPKPRTARPAQPASRPAKPAPRGTAGEHAPAPRSAPRPGFQQMGRRPTKPGARKRAAF